MSSMFLVDAGLIFFQNVENPESGKKYRVDIPYIPQDDIVEAAAHAKSLFDDMYSDKWEGFSTVISTKQSRPGEATLTVGAFRK